MNRNMLKLGLAVLLSASVPSFAQTGGAKPADATALCKDGTYSTIPNKAQSCRGHQGVKTWYQTVGGPDDPSLKGGTGTQHSNGKHAASANSTVNPNESQANVSGSRAQAVNKKSPNAVVATPSDNGKTIPGPAMNGTAAQNGMAGNGAKGSSGHGMTAKTAAPGGGPNLVWVNTDSNVYHCYGTQYYGKTKQGKYESEQQAQQAGAKPDHGKSCSK